MQAPHAIKTLRFELLADAVPQARRLPERFSALCRQQLAEVLEEEFAAHCQPHQQLRLPQLVLELPAIADRRLEAELPNLLRQALRTALGKLSEGEKTTVTTVPEATSWLAVLEHFLRYGRLPWQVAAGSFSLDEVLRSVVEHQATAFRALLVRLGQTAQRRQRLVWQLNADQLQLLLLVLEPIHAPFLHAYVLATLAAHRRQPLAPVTATALRSIIYELVLADLLLHAGTAFNRRAFLERQVRQLAAQYNLSFPQLLQQLGAAELALTPRTQSALSVLLEDLHQRYRPAFDAPGTGGPIKATSDAPTSTAIDASTGVTNASEGVSADVSTTPAAALAYFLLNGSLPPTTQPLTPQQLRAAFPAWLAQGWRELRPALRAGGPATLHRLAHLLTEPLLLQLLRLAVPGRVRPVQGVLESVWQQPATQAAGLTRPDLWALTCRYLLREDFRSFSSPEFQQWLVQHLATTGRATAVSANGFFDDNAIAGNNTPAPGRDWATANAASAGTVSTLGQAPAASTAAATAHTAPTTSTAAADGHAPASSSAPLSLLQAQQVLQYYLAEGTVPPWWPGAEASPARRRALLAQVLRARPLPDFLRTQPLAAEARQRLAELANFPQLTTLLMARRLPGCSPAPAASALAALERRESVGAVGQASGWLLLLRAAYLNFYLDGGRAATASGVELRDLRQLAARYQLPVPATLGKARRLLSTQPTLLADAFFASLNLILPSPVAVHASAQVPASRPTTREATPPATAANAEPGNSFQKDKSLSGEPESTRPGESQKLASEPENPSRQSGDNREQSEKLPGAPAKIPGVPENPSGASGKQSGPSSNAPTESEISSDEAARHSSAPEDSAHLAAQVAVRLTEAPTGLAARDLIFYLLRYQQLPWWAPANLTLAQQRQLLTQVAHEYRASLQALVQAHRAKPAFRQMLAELASFAQLARFVSQPGKAAPGHLPPAVLAALDQQLARAGEPVARLLRQAYLTTAFHANPADIRTLAAEMRAQATRAGTAWRTVLRYVGWLHRQLPALATAPFFAALLAATATYEQQASGRLQRNASARPRATGAPQHQIATTTFQALEEYLRTGQPLAFSTDMTSANNVVLTKKSAAESSVSNGSGAAGRGAAAAGLPQLLATRWQLLVRPEHRAAWQPLKPLLASRTVRARLLAGLSEAEFWQLLRQLYPSHYRLAFRLAADWQLLARQGLVKLSTLALFEVLLALIQAKPVASWRPETVVSALLAAEETLWPQAAKRREHSRAGQLLAAIGRRGLVLRGPLGALLLVHHQAGQVAKPAPPPSTPIPFIKEEDRPLETIYLTNAGLVLLWPFLTMLFDRLGYLENQQFRDETSRQRAALLLQFLASGASEVPEYQLPLNKLLCGMPQSQPLPRELALSEAETELGESLLKAVIARWDALKNTSIAGLRETFLLRPGKLDWLPDDRIVLTVEPKTLDILLDRRPWSISIIKLPWMAAPLYVTWR